MYEFSFPILSLFGMNPVRWVDDGSPAKKGSFMPILFWSWAARKLWASFFFLLGPTTLNSDKKCLLFHFRMAFFLPLLSSSVSPKGSGYFYLS